MPTVTEHHFDLVMVWDNLGGAVRVRRNGTASVVDPATGAPVTVTENDQPTTTVHADDSGRVTFTAGQGVVKLVSGGLSMVVVSAEQRTAGAEAAAEAQAAQVAAEGASASALTAAADAQSARDEANAARDAADAAVSQFAHASQKVSTSTLTVGPTRVIPGVDSQYAAFPSISRTNDGRIIMVWYQATDHLTTRDGNIMASYSSDLGRTWTPAATIVNDATDLRDPVVRLIGSKLFLTYCRGSAAQAWQGSLLRISQDDGATWGPEIRIDGGQEYAAITAPIVDLGDGRLLATWNAKRFLTDARPSAWVATSTDQGASWSAPTKVVDGVALGFDVYEPWISKRGATLVMTYRVNERQDIGRVVSTDNGATWSAHSTVITGASGRPATTFLDDGALILAHRNVKANNYDSGLIRYSRDNGATWSSGKVLEQAEPNFWVYTDFLEVHAGIALAATATERSATSAVVSLRYVAMGAANTPFGDSLGNRAADILNDRRHLAVADDFDRPDSSSLGYAPTGQQWTKVSSVLSLNSGSIYLPSDGSTGIRYAVVDPRAALVDVVADFVWDVNAGFGIVFRYVDASNHWFFTMETNGTNARLYERVSGTATQKGTVALTTPANAWTRLRVVDSGTLIRCYVEDSLALGVTATTTSNKSVGVQLASAPGATQRCRRFVVHRRSDVI